MAKLDHQLRAHALHAAQRYRSPFYLLDIDRIIERTVSIAAEWKREFPHFRLVYPYKANALTAITANLAARGMAAEVGSGSHLLHALDDGFPVDGVLLAGAAKRDDEIERALLSGTWLSIDSLSELGRMKLLAESLQLAPRFLIRLSILAGGEWSRFGILPDEYGDLLDQLMSSRLRLGGFAFHLGSHRSDPRVHAEVVRMYAPLIQHQLELQHDQTLIIDIGGGFPSLSGSKLDEVPDTDQFAREVHGAVTDCNIDLDRIELWIEPGRTLTESYGLMLCTVVATKTRGERSLVFVDVGGNVLASTSAFREVEIISNRTESSAARKHEIHGSLCVESDVIHKSVVSEHEVRLGDLVLISHTGAYDISTASEWMGEMPAILGIVHGDLVTLRTPAVPPARRGMKISIPTGAIK